MSDKNADGRAEPLIEFDITPDATGLGRVNVDGKYYGLPAAVVRKFAALTAQGAEQSAGAVSLSAESWAKLCKVFARRFPRCRDCADENGVCPHSGLPCEFDSMLLSSTPPEMVSVPREPTDKEMLDWLEDNHFFSGARGSVCAIFAWEFQTPNNGRQWQPLREKIALAMAAAKEGK
jgi:hypothetical protein